MENEADNLYYKIEKYQTEDRYRKNMEGWYRNNKVMCMEFQHSQSLCSRLTVLNYILNTSQLKK